MKILVDEHIPFISIKTLRLLGHNVHDIRGIPQEGIQDDNLWEERLLITTDPRFTQNRTAPHHGVLVIRLRRPNRHRIHQRIMQVVTQFPKKDWPGLVVVVRDDAQSIWRARESA